MLEDASGWCCYTHDDGGPWEYSAVELHFQGEAAHKGEKQMAGNHHLSVETHVIGEV